MFLLLGVEHSSICSMLQMLRMGVASLLPKRMGRCSPRLMAIAGLLFVGWLVVYLFPGRQKAANNEKDFVMGPFHKENHFAQSLNVKDPFNRNNPSLIDAPITPTEGMKFKGFTRKRTLGGPCDRVHIFYYAWYGNPEHDGQYLHWNHPYLPYWGKRRKQPSAKLRRHEPPDDISSDFYPALGPYSSRDPAVIQDHIEQITFAGAGVLVVSYYPVGQGDDHGKDWSGIYPLLFNAADKADLQVAFHIEPYKDRSHLTIKKDIEWILTTYGNHPALYRTTKRSDKNGHLLPLIYVYDSYRTSAEDWSTVLRSDGMNTIRGTRLDCVVIGLIVEPHQRDQITVAHFDGLYTYFATDRFTYGSSWDSWKALSKFADETNTHFIPSVGPGYTDISIRVWNGENTRLRDHGDYYKEAWNVAVNSSPSYITITSFNEWHEGTQIEKAVQHPSRNRTYYSYKPYLPNYYLGLTKMGIKKFPQCLGMTSLK